MLGLQAFIKLNVNIFISKVTLTFRKKLCFLFIIQLIVYQRKLKKLKMVATHHHDFVNVIPKHSYTKNCFILRNESYSNSLLSISALHVTQQFFLSSWKFCQNSKLPGPFYISLEGTICQPQDLDVIPGLPALVEWVRLENKYRREVCQQKRRV